MTDFEIASQIVIIAFALVGLFFSLFEAYMRWYELKPRIRVTIYESRLPDRSELKKVSSEKSFHEMWDKQPKYVFVRADNIGNKSVTLLSPKISAPNHLDFVPDLNETDSRWQSTVDFPHELMPAKSCNVWVPLENLKNYLRRGEGFEGKMTLRAAYVGEVGNEYYSKRTWSEKLRRPGKERHDELTVMFDNLKEPDWEAPSRFGLKTSYLGVVGDIICLLLASFSSFSLMLLCSLRLYSRLGIK